MAISRPSSSVFNRKTFTIAAGATLTLDTLALADFVARKYLIDAVAPGKFRALEMSVSRAGSDVVDAVTHKLGDNVLAEFSFEKVGSDALLKAKNNEAVSIDVTFLRI